MILCFMIAELSIGGFGVTDVLRVQYKMERMNRLLERMDNGQMTPRGYPNFNTHGKKNYVPCIPEGQRN
jgi:hypothetical protein